MSNWFEQHIPIDKEAGIDPTEIEAIKRFIAKLPAVVGDHARDHEPDETLRWLKALYQISRALVPVTAEEIERLFVQMQTGVRTHNQSSLGTPGVGSQSGIPQSSTRTDQPDPGYVSNLTGWIRALLNYCDVEIPSARQLSVEDIPSLVLEARANKDQRERELEEAKRTPKPAPITSDPNTISKKEVAKALRNAMDEAGKLDENARGGRRGNNAKVSFDALKKNIEDYIAESLDK